MDNFELEKWIWTESDFEKMGWHDATVYGIRLNNNLEIDLDYIFQWDQPEVEGFHFTFWVAPCTLVFESPKELTFELTQSFDDKWLEIEDIEMNAQGNEKHWTIITQQDHKVIMKNIRTSRVSISKANLDNIEKNNKKFDGKIFIEYEVKA